MNIIFVDSKPCIAVSNGFQPVSDSLYHELIERGELKIVEVVEHD